MTKKSQTKTTKKQKNCQISIKYAKRQYFDSILGYYFLKTWQQKEKMVIFRTNMPFFRSENGQWPLPTLTTFFVKSVNVCSADSQWRCPGSWCSCWLAPHSSPRSWTDSQSPAGSWTRTIPYSSPTLPGLKKWLKCHLCKLSCKNIHVLQVSRGHRCAKVSGWHPTPSPQGSENCHPPQASSGERRVGKGGCGWWRCVRGGRMRQK